MECSICLCLSVSVRLSLSLSLSLSVSEKTVARCNKELFTSVKCLCYKSVNAQQTRKLNIKRYAVRVPKIKLPKAPATHNRNLDLYRKCPSYLKRSDSQGYCTSPHTKTERKKSSHESQHRVDVSFLLLRITLQ